MNNHQTEKFINEMWDDSIIPELCEYIKIPNKSPMFDPDLVTGLLGPKSNAHGPNEFLHIETGKRLTCCVAQVLEDHMNR